jgi:hypothetical protein
MVLMWELWELRVERGKMEKGCVQGSGVSKRHSTGSRLRGSKFKMNVGMRREIVVAD